MSRTIDFHRESKSPSVYKYSIVNPQNGQNTVSLVGTAQREVVFELPSRAMNLHRTYLNIEFKTPAQGVGHTSWLWKDIFGLIDNMRLRTSGNVELMRLEYARMYMKLLKKDIKIEDFITFADEEFPYPNRNESAKGEDEFPTGGEIMNKLHPVYVQSAGGNAANNNAHPTVRVRFNLGKFIGTIFEVDKTLYFPESIFLHMMLGPWRNLGFSVDTAVAATPAGVAAELVGNGITLNNVHLAVAIEKNPDTAALVMNTVNTTGLSVPIPVTLGYENNISGSTQTVTVRLSAGSGQLLRRFFHTCIRQDYVADPVRRYNISNQVNNENEEPWSPDNVASYYVMVDNVRASGDMDIDCKEGHDWLANRKHLIGSVIQNRQMYCREWHHQEDFSGLREDPSDEFEGVPKTNLSDGLDLINKERKIDIVMRMGANAGRAVDAWRTHYTFCEIERTLYISRENIGMDMNGAAYVTAVV